MAIFNSHVSLPEGNLGHRFTKGLSFPILFSPQAMKRGKWKATKFTLINFPAINFHLVRGLIGICHLFPLFSHLFPYVPMIFLWFSYDVPIFSHEFPMIFPGFSYGFPKQPRTCPRVANVAGDLQEIVRKSLHTIREADFNPSLWWYNGNGNNKLAGRKPSYLAGENRAGKCQTNQPRWNDGGFQ